MSKDNPNINYFLYWNDKEFYSLRLPQNYTNKQVRSVAIEECKVFNTKDREKWQLMIAGSVVKVEKHVARKEE